MESMITGKIIVVGDNIDTDQIYPGRYLALTDPAEIGSHCLSGVDEGIAGVSPRAALSSQAAISDAAPAGNTHRSHC